MKIKLDENIPASAGPRLAALGFDVDTVLSEGLTGRTDSEVWAARVARRGRDRLGVAGEGAAGRGRHAVRPRAKGVGQGALPPEPTACTVAPSPEQVRVMSFTRGEGEEPLDRGYPPGATAAPRDSFTDAAVPWVRRG